MTRVDQDRLQRARDIAVAHLLTQRNAAGHWVGELSTSALSTATAVMALYQFSQRATDIRLPSSPTSRQAHACRSLIERGIGWLLANQNSDGGWGDTSQSFSNISTTMLCHATLVATRDFGADASFTTLAQNQLVTREDAIARGAAFIEKAGGIPALIARYGKDKTFSVPILTHCALAGLVPWAQVPRLPFELACIPARWYAAAKFPVVSYALPALIAIGQVRHFHGPTWNPITRALRWLARDRSLKVLEKIQPPNGGFLEAAPLTSFVCMSLAAMGLTEHPVVQRGIDFLVKSVRPDGSWPIDTNLATWVTTLAVNALGEDLPHSQCKPTLKWILEQQFFGFQPYTNSPPGGWAWTNLPGGVPDADDTPGALLAVNLLDRRLFPEQRGEGFYHLRRAVRWLLDVQNNDGGFPTFCKGWGTLPFDRSSPDITAHCLRSLHGWLKLADDPWDTHGIRDYPQLPRDMSRDIPLVQISINRGFKFLERVQRPNGSWLPLWFGNQHVPNDENPVYGTSRVLRAFRDCDRWNDHARRGAEWLRSAQNPDGGWGGDAGAPSTVEETALALDALLDAPQPLNTQPSTLNDPLGRGVEWLIQRVEDGTWTTPSPIGFYFAKLWYYEALYPVVWTVAALRKAVQRPPWESSLGCSGAA